MKGLLARLEAKIEASQAKTDVKLNERSTEIKSVQEEMKSTVNAIRSDLRGC
jgi:hypothetical protein